MEIWQTAGVSAKFQGTNKPDSRFLFLSLCHMERIHLNGLRLWQFDQLGKVAGIRHFVTDRHSLSDDQEFTLSYSSTPDRGKVKTNRDQLAAAMGIPAPQLFLPSQVHETRIVKVGRDTSVNDLWNTDALITDSPELCIAVMSADCVPILLYDAVNKAVGAVHSGWRGTVARILEKTLHAMKNAYGTRGGNVLACIGPSVSQDAYEVGAEVVAAVEDSFGRASDLLRPQPDGKAKLDLWKANAIQLEAFGVPPSQIELANLCSVINNEHFFSARKGDTGRFAAGILLSH